jgi:hypothetical protein
MNKYKIELNSIIDIKHSKSTLHTRKHDINNRRYGDFHDMAGIK